MSKQMNMQPMEDFVSSEIFPEEMARVLDEVAYEYTCRWLMDTESCPPFKQEADNLYLLRLLRDTFRQMTVKEE